MFPLSSVPHFPVMHVAVLSHVQVKQQSLPSEMSMSLTKLTPVLLQFQSAPCNLTKIRLHQQCIQLWINAPAGGETAKGDQQAEG